MPLITGLASGFALTSEAAALAFASSGQGGGGMGGLAGTLLPLVAMMGILWFLLIRPQQKEQQRHRDMVRNLKKGDEVVTLGGIYGKVLALTEEKVTLRIAENVKIDVERSKIARVLTTSVEKKTEEA
jgi:preprotein translocase subunit YajC